MSASGKGALMGWYAQWYSEPVSHCGRLSAKGVAVLCMTLMFFLLGSLFITGQERKLTKRVDRHLAFPTPSLSAAKEQFFKF